MRLALSSLKLLAVVFLVLLNGFFVASEFAIVKVRSSQLDALAARGNGHARLGATILLGLGGWRLWRTRHPIWVGMRVGFWDLACWSWIMASAHGAGVMLIPLLLGATCGQTLTGKSNLLFSSPPFAAGAVLVHTVSHLAVSGILAWLVYDCIGLAVLRRSWFNVDLIWSFSLLMGGALLLFTTVTAIR
jgi:hypothetical protein